MNSGIGIFRGNSHAGGYGRVHVRASDLSSPLTVEVCLDDDECNNQLRDGRFPDWIEASIYGLRYALKQADAEQGTWTIHRIVGLLVDTNPTFVAVAAARAAWKALNFSPPHEVDDRLQKLALEARGEAMPSF